MTQKVIGSYFLCVKANGGCPLKIWTDYRTENGHDSLKAVLLLWIFVLQVSVMLSCMSVFDGLWSPAGRGLTSWLSLVMSNSEFCYFPIDILGQVWYLILSIPDLCSFSYFYVHVAVF